MQKGHGCAALALVLACAVVVPGREAIATPVGKSSADQVATDAATLNGKFDPQRDPSADLRAAIAEAKRSGRRIMLDVGGEWCIWCHRMDAFIEGDSELREFRSTNYVWVKINYSEENENQKFLSGYPKIKAYPHLFVLDADGKLLHSQFTGVLELGKSYDKEKFAGFLRTWAPSRRT